MLSYVFSAIITNLLVCNFDDAAFWMHLLPGLNLQSVRNF